MTVIHDDDIPRSRRSLVVFGDTNVDIQGTLPQGTGFRELADDPVVYLPLECRSGGALSNLSVAALSHFEWVGAVGTIGMDAFGTVIVEHLGRMGVRRHLIIDSERPTGVALALREVSEVTFRRAMLVDSRSAGKWLHETAIEQIASDWLVLAGHVFIDGYLLLAPSARIACMAAMQIASDAGAVVSVDLVPHHLWRQATLEELTPLLAHARIVISEVGTILRLFNDSSDAKPPYSRLAAYLAADYLRAAFPEKDFILRFGKGGVAESLVDALDGERYIDTIEYGIESTIVGVGDLLTARQLAMMRPYEPPQDVSTNG